MIFNLNRSILRGIHVNVNVRPLKTPIYLFHLINIKLSHTALVCFYNVRCYQLCLESQDAREVMRVSERRHHYKKKSF